MLKRLPSAEAEAPLSEPHIIDDLFLDGLEVRAGAHVARFVGWVSTPNVGPESQERRIVVRFALPLDAARALWTDLADDLDEERREVRHAVASAQLRDATMDN
jgi:hypothetical protein